MNESFLKIHNIHIYSYPAGGKSHSLRKDGQTSQSKQSLFSTALLTRLKTDKSTEERHSLTRLYQMIMTRNVSVVQLVA
jgi:hypothetical protein